MTTTTGKQAAAAAKTLLAERIALVETLGAALDTHRRAEEAVTTARAAAATAAQQARDAYDAAKTGGWTAAELTKAGLRAPNPARPRTTKSTKPPHKITEAYVPADTADDVAGAARACSGSQLPAPLLIAPMVKLHSPSPPTSPPSRRSSSCSSALRGCDSPARRAASRAANKSGATSCAPAAAPRCHHTCGDQLPFLHTVLAARSPLREQCGSGVQRQTPSRFTPLPRQAFPCLLRPGVCFQAVWHQRAAAL